MPKAIFIFICLFTTISLQAVNVTFQVDLSQEPTVSDSGVHLLGSMNGWNPAADSLSHLGNDRYALTLSFNAGEALEFKYVNGNAWGEEEIVFGHCEFTTYRTLLVPANDTVLPMVCFGHCDSACSPVTGSRIACIGNSILWGLGTTNRITDSPPSILRDSLQPGALVVNFAAPGVALFRNAGNSIWTNPQYRYAKAFQPDTVLVMLGTNDSKTALWTPYSQDFYPDYDSLITELTALPSDPRLLLVCPPRAFASTFGIQDAVIAGQIIPAIRELARVRCLEVVDMYARTAGLGTHFPDGIHPNDSASRVIAHALQEALNRSPFSIFQSGNQLSAPLSADYQWYFEGDTVAASLGGRGQTLLAQQTGTYKVAVQPDSVLEDVHVSEAYAYVAVGEEEGEAEVALRLWPVPARDLVRMEVRGMREGALRVWDVDGAVVFGGWFREGEAVWEVGEWAAGVYVVEIEHNGKRISKRLVVN